MMTVIIIFEKSQHQHGAIPRTVWWSVYSLIQSVLAPSCKVVEVLGCFCAQTAGKKNPKIMFVSFFFSLSALPSLTWSSLFIHFLALFTTVFLSTAAKTNAEFCH